MIHQTLPFLCSKFVVQGLQTQETFSGGRYVGEVERGEPGRGFWDIYHFKNHGKGHNRIFFFFFAVKIGHDEMDADNMIAPDI